MDFHRISRFAIRHSIRGLAIAAQIYIGPASKRIVLP
jgi:hypothetical protein